MPNQSAVLNNQRLFNAYAEKLCSCNAYYNAARHEVGTEWTTLQGNLIARRDEIIKLLTIALSTILRAVGAVDQAERFHVSSYVNHPMVPQYVKLIQVVRQYIYLFVEPELAVQIRYLISTVNLPPTKANSQEFRTEQALVQAPYTLAANSAAATRDTTPAKAETLASPSESPNMSSANAPIQGVPQRIKRKRKTLEQLVDVDQRKLRENMTSMQASLTPKELKEPIDSEELANVVPRTNADSQPVSELRPLEVTVSPRSVPTDATAEPSRTSSVDRAIAADGKITSATAHLPQVEENYSTFVKSEENQQLYKVVTDVTSAQLTSTVVTSAKSKVEIPSDSQANTEFTPSRDEAVAKSVQAGALTPSGPVDQDGAVLPATNGDAVQSNDDDWMDVDDSMDVDDLMDVEGPATLDGDEMELEHESPVQGQVVEKLQEIHDRLSQYASQMPLPCGDLSSTFSKSIDQEDAASGNTKAIDLQVTLPRIRVEQDPKSDHIEETIHQEKEGVDMNSLSLVHPSLLMVKVPTLVRGLSNPGKVAISFEIKQGVHAALSRWTRRDTLSTEFADAICITLGCYQATEAALKAVASKSERDWRGFVSTHQSTWPETGTLQLSFTAGNGCSHLPLSPPFLVTPDNLFDLSHLLVLGANEFELQFTQDMSKYLFALVIHSPTPAQLAGRHDRSKREQDWKDWLHDLSQPFHVA
ncbi:hypothetical protein APHAL10511_001340 [Amanita phalloides]|nr:hypothetical protein APHAL10511_001340 [Amanita phalloides]